MPNSAKLQDGNTHANNSAMTHKFLDRANIGTVRKTQEGYLVARSRIARTGVQEYLARELGDQVLADGFNANDIVRVYRPPEEVFSDATKKSLTRIPVTIEHPPEMVNAENYRKYAVGEVGDSFKIEEESGWYVVDPMIKDADAIYKMETTHKEWSAGYTAELRKSRVDGADYEMFNIRFNHLAGVPRGRAGSEARIGDGAANQWGVAPLTTSKEVPKVEMKAVAIGDKAINVAATDADALKNAIEAKDKKIGELEGAIAAKDAEIADAKAKILTDEQIKEKAKAMADAMARREKVKAALGDKAADMTDAQIEGALAVIDAGAVANDTIRAALGDAMKGAKGKEMSPMEAFYAERDKKKGAK